MFNILRSDERGSYRNDWLNAKFSFEFGSYINSERRGYSDLLVFNDDMVQPNSGFSEHPHSNVEVMSYPLIGEVEHRDSLGNHKKIKYGDVQLISAGRGITHSEMNTSPTVEHHVQWWIRPKHFDSDPRYQLRSYTVEEKIGRFCLIASNDIDDNVLCLDQDVRIYACILTALKLEWSANSMRRTYIHVLTGTMIFQDQTLEKGDAVTLCGEGVVSMTSFDGAEILLFDLR